MCGSSMMNPRGMAPNVNSNNEFFGLPSGGPMVGQNRMPQSVNMPPAMPRTQPPSTISQVSNCGYNVNLTKRFFYSTFFVTLY